MKNIILILSLIYMSDYFQYIKIHIHVRLFPVHKDPYNGEEMNKNNSNINFHINEMMFTDNSNINFHINEMHAEFEILPADFKAIFQKVKSGRGPSPEWISGDGL